jgi:hypothetical protein
LTPFSFIFSYWLNWSIKKIDDINSQRLCSNLQSYAGLKVLLSDEWEGLKGLINKAWRDLAACLFS